MKTKALLFLAFPLLAGQKINMDEGSKRLLERHKSSVWDLEDLGLKSFKARLRFRHEEILVSWRKGREPSFKDLETGRKVKDSMKGLLQAFCLDIKGKPDVSKLPEDASGVFKPEGAEDGRIIMKGKRRIGRMVFERKTGLLTSLEVENRISISYGYRPFKGRNMISFRRISTSKGEVALSYKVHGVFSGFPLPAFVSISLGNKEMEGSIAWEKINGMEPVPELMDPKEVERIVKEFEKRFREYSESGKAEELKKLSVVPGHRITRILISKLNHKSVLVKETAAELLGKRGDKAAVPSLLSLFKKEKKNLSLLVSICRALGEIGDPRALKPLARNITGGNMRSPDWRELARERINAISRIKTREAVSELVSLLFKSGRGGRRVSARGSTKPTGFQRTVMGGLRRLTGQKFETPLAWRKWWKKNKNTFRFEK